MYILYLTLTDGFGSWSSGNCRVVYESGDRTRCECSQAAHFGLLFVRTHPIADSVEVTMCLYCIVAGFESRGILFSSCTGDCHIHWNCDLCCMLCDCHTHIFNIKVSLGFNYFTCSLICSYFTTFGRLRQTTHGKMLINLSAALLGLYLTK